MSNFVLITIHSDCHAAADFFQSQCHVVLYTQHTYTHPLYHFVHEDKIKIPFILLRILSQKVDCDL